MEQVSRGHQQQVEPRERRKSSRERVALAGRVVWRDAWGTTRFATVRTRDVNDAWAFVECLSGMPIPLYRLVHLQLDHVPAAAREVPDSLRRGKVLSAVYRVGPSQPSTGLPDGYALRLLVDPQRPRAVSIDVNAGPSQEPGEMIA